MKEIVGYLRSHLQEDFKPGYYAFMAIFLAFIVWLNFWGFAQHILPILAPHSAYSKKTTIEGWVYIQYADNTFKLLLGYLVFYGTPYLVAVFAHVIAHRDRQLLQKREFWVRVFVALFIISFDASMRLYRFIDIDAFTDYWFGPHNNADYYWVRKCIANISSIFAIGGLTFMVWLAWDRRRGMKSMYGLTWRNFHWQPYAIMMGMMAVLVGAASFLEHFTSYYPTLKPHRIAEISVVPREWAIAIYQTLYGLDFIWTEVSFRGFMILGLAMVAGRAAVMPMATVYCVRHFAKPAGEAISSIFGGFILGVIALRSRNIMGGIWIHMGVALLMDLTAWLQIGAR